MKLANLVSTGRQNIGSTYFCYTRLKEVQKKQRPKIGDRVEFLYHGGVRIGRIIAMDEIGVHFLIEFSTWRGYKQARIGLAAIVKILPKEEPKKEDVKFR